MNGLICDFARKAPALSPRILFAPTRITDPIWLVQGVAMEIINCHGGSRWEFTMEGKLVKMAPKPA